MNFNKFRQEMPKPVFRLAEAEQVTWETSPRTLRLELHQWVRRGELVRLKRGVYCFPDRVRDQSEIARALYEPAYISFESALHYYGLIPDAVFALTLATPKATRTFTTSLGQFIYHRLKPDLFWGYDPDTLMAEREKALADYLYLNSAFLVSERACWEGLRWHNLGEVDFKKLKDYGQKTGIKKMINLVASLEEYGKNQEDRS